MEPVEPQPESLPRSEPSPLDELFGGISSPGNADQRERLIILDHAGIRPVEAWDEHCGEP